MKCPKCRFETVRESFAGIEIDRCTSCKGILLDKGELQSLLVRQLGGAADTFAFSPMTDVLDSLAAECLSCNQLMTRVATESGIEVDICSGCRSVFLDQGELASMQLDRS